MSEVIVLAGSAGEGSSLGKVKQISGGRHRRGMPTSIYIPEDKMVELRKSRAYVGQTPEQRGMQEDSIKSRYTISDHDSGRGIGYVIHDTQNETDTYFSPNSRLTLETRYLEKNDQKEATENALDLFARVAVNIAEADLKYDSTANITHVAAEFLDMMVRQQFMPNTPTLCNAGRSLQQLSACFVLPVEDYMATDDIGDDPEKQGNGIYDAMRYMAMIHKSGGGTGFNFGHLRPRSDMISTTFGSSSGPVSFMRTFDASTNAVNQGGFRRGANMAILPYSHPDIFEFVGEKARNHTMPNFNLSVGIDDTFMKAVREDGYFKLINPKNETTVPEEKRVWKRENLLMKGTERYKTLRDELNPSLVVAEDGKGVISTVTDKVVGKIGQDGSVLVSAGALFDYIAECAWEDGCPGIINLERLEKNNLTPNVGKIEATNPCGEQPLFAYEACNLGGLNLASCVKEGEVDYGELERRINTGIHFLDNVIDMSKFPFQKVYGMVHGTRKVGLGMMGWAEMLTQLKIPYSSDEAVELAGKISDYVTETARKASEGLAETRGTFPLWEGSVHEREGRSVRNATGTTIAPNGTTGMIADSTGGIESYFKVAYKKTCMDGRELIYIADGLEEALKNIGDTITSGGENGRDVTVWERVLKTGSLQGIEEIPKEIRDLYQTAHDISPENHVRMQAAFQVGNAGVGVDNAVSKTVNLPNEATIEDVKKIYFLADELGCVGTTVFRDGCKAGVFSGLEKKVELVQNNVQAHPILDKKPQAIKYRIRRENNGDSLHVILTSDLFADDKASKAYFVPSEDFQVRAPLGDAISVSFEQSGIDRTEILRGPDPDYAEIIGRLQSASSNEEEGLGPRKIKSVEHAVGVALEDLCLRNGIVGIDGDTKRLVNKVKKPSLRKIEIGTEEYASIMSQVRVEDFGEELVVIGNHSKLSRKFECACGCEDYFFEAGCHHPKCKNCGEVAGDGC